MDLQLSHNSKESIVDVKAIGRFIASIQKESGEIPWSVGGKTDPWDHVESAMGLSIAGFYREAERAYEWLAETQMSDGSWWAAIRNDIPEDTTRDANFCSYIAVGVLNHFLITRDLVFLKSMWTTVRDGVDFAVRLQAPSGQIYWARNVESVVDRNALLTGSSSVYFSIKCALAIAGCLGIEKPLWNMALKKLGFAIRFKPELFDMTKSRYSMDWYYPILCGAVSGREAQQRLENSWEKFVVPGWGVRCVSDRPWATMAETAELALALASLGEMDKAKVILNWLSDKRYPDGSYWMGVTFPDAVVWPEEKTSWTAAAVLLAFDSLYQITAAASMFSHAFWKNRLVSPQSGKKRNWEAPSTGPARLEL